MCNPSKDRIELDMSRHCPYQTCACAARPTATKKEEGEKGTRRKLEESRNGVGSTLAQGNRSGKEIVFSVDLGLRREVDRVEELERHTEQHRSTLLPRSPEIYSNPKGNLIDAPTSLQSVLGGE